MRYLFTISLSALIAGVGTVSAIIAIPALEERVRDAEVIVVGILKRTKGDETWQSGHIVVERVLKGKAKAGEKIPVRWKSPPKKAADPNQPQLADYTFRPALEKRQIFILPLRKDKKEGFTLNWGSTEPLENEKKVQAAIAKAADQSNSPNSKRSR